MKKPDDGPLAVMIREAMALIDVGALFTDPVFYGVHVPPGDGKLVAILPGLFGSDSYLQPLHNWLRCMGYSPVRSTLTMNAGCMDDSREAVQLEIDRQLGGSRRPIALIGHSRGGTLAWSIAARMQERVSHLVMLGSPVPDYLRAVETKEVNIALGPMTRILLHASKFSRRMLDPNCRFPSCECAFVTDIESPLSPATSLLAIYGRDDLVVPEAARVTAAETIEVPASHVGLVYSPEVYRALGRFLARDNSARQSLSSPSAAAG